MGRSESESQLAGSSAAVTDTLANQLEAFRQKTASEREAPKAALDPSAQEKLGALGYMASGKDASKESAAEQRSDPKDKIDIANMIHRAEVLQQDMHSDESIALLEQVVAKEPGLPLYDKLGYWLMRKQDYQQAVPVLRKGGANESRLIARTSFGSWLEFEWRLRISVPLCRSWKSWLLRCLILWRRTAPGLAYARINRV